MLIFSPSKLIVDSLRNHVGIDLPPGTGNQAETPTHCSACGVHIAAGDDMAWLRPNQKSFTDWQYLTHESFDDGAVPVCPHCAALFGQAFVQQIQSRAAAAVYSNEGAWMLTRDSERKWFLLTPPNPPYVAMIATTMGQHVAWRAPLTLDNNLIRIAVGRRVITINRPRLMEASSLCFGIADRVRAEMKKPDGKPVTLVPNHPFVALDRKMEVSAHGVIRPSIRKWMSSNEMDAEIAMLESLGDGELWGLSVLNKAKIEDPIEVSVMSKLAARVSATTEV
jgi:CRISPR type IV-associated protein Csf1